MSVNTADRIQSNGQDADGGIARKFDSFMDVVTDTFESLGATDDQVSAIESMGKQLGEEIDTQVSDNSNHDLEQEHQQLQQEHEQLEQDHQQTRREAADDRQRIHELEQTESDTEQAGADDSRSSPHTSTDSTTALEQVCALPEHIADDNLTQNQQRARSIARRIDEYGDSVMAGVAITSSRIKRVLTAQEDSTIHRQTIQRVAQFLQKFAPEDVKIKKTRGGKTTVVFDEELANDVTSVVTADTDSSVTTPAIT